MTVRREPYTRSLSTGEGHLRDAGRRASSTRWTRGLGHRLRHNDHHEVVLAWPDRIDVPFDDFLPEWGRIVRHFGERIDSRTRILGVETELGRYVVKHASADEESVGWLKSAIAFHGAVSHASIRAIVHHITTPDGLAVIEEWASGEVLVDSFDPTVSARDDPTSPYQRFLGLAVSEVVHALTQLIDAHVALTRAGFVAVDLYDGCLVYDFERRQLSLIDLDLYRPGPYVLETERQYGSDAFMAPEEWEKGARIDERTTVFTLGRFVAVLLGCDRYGPAEPAEFRGSDELFDIAMRACAPDPADRFGSVLELSRHWNEASQRESTPPR